MMREFAQEDIGLLGGMCDGDNPPEQYLRRFGHSKKAYAIWREECYKYNNY